MGNLLNYLVENGGCSIKYRVKREILQEDRTSSEMVALQNEILSRPRVRKYLAAQHEDGWIGESLHGCGCKALDASVAYLLSRGVEKDAPPLRKVVDALKAILSLMGIQGQNQTSLTVHGFTAATLSMKADGEETKRSKREYWPVWVRKTIRLSKSRSILP